VTDEHDGIIAGHGRPVLLDEHDGIIAGHGRVLAAKKLGLADVPCMVARGWSDAQRKAYALADNKLALNAKGRCGSAAPRKRNAMTPKMREWRDFV
jgi:ParB-like nuclease domain